MNRGLGIWRFLCLVLLTGCASMCSPGDALRSGPVKARVIFDQSKGQIYTPFDGGFFGASQVAMALRSHGLSVEVNARPLTTLLGELHGRGHLLVLNLFLRGGYSEAELVALHEAMTAGLGVVVLAEHDNFFGTAERQNALLMRYGIEVRHDAALSAISTEENQGGGWLKATSSVGPHDNVQMPLPVAFKLSGESESFLEQVAPATEGGRHLGARTAVGKGWIAAVGDCEIFWNGTPRMGASVGNNLPFIVDMFQELAGTVSGTEPYMAESSGTKKGTVLFSSAGGAWTPTFHSHPLTPFARRLEALGYRVQVQQGELSSFETFEAVIVIAPVEDSPALERVGETARKVLLIADGVQQGLDQLCEHEQEGLQECHEMSAEMRTFVDYDKKASTVPLNRIAARYGLKIPPKTVVSNRPNLLVSRAVWGEKQVTWELFRSGVLEIEPGKEGAFSVLAVTKGKTRSVFGLVPMYSGDPQAQLGYLERIEQESPAPEIVALRGTEVFAVADMELVLNHQLSAPVGEAFVGELEAWLASDKP